MQNRFFIWFILCLSIAPAIGFSQCTSDGPKNPTIFVDDASVGTLAWSSLSNVASSDNNRATAGVSVGILSTTETNYIVATGFGFSIPSTAVICGIQLEAERRQQGVSLGSSVKDNTVKIVKGGVIMGTEHASGTDWPSSDTYSSYGGSGDLWGTTWTVADINSTNFGVAYASASLNTGLAALFLSAQIDNVRITVYYSNPLPIQLIDFSAVCENNNIDLKWTTASQTDNNYFTIERSSDGINFEKAGVIDGAGNTNKIMNYSFIDDNSYKGESYYRLKQTDFNGSFEYLQTIPVDCDFVPTQLFFPNPSSGKFTIATAGDLTIYDLHGYKIYTQQNVPKGSEIDLSAQAKGLYFYLLRSFDKIISSGKLMIQ